MILALALIVAFVPWAAYLTLRLLRFLHILQLEEYQNARYGRWLRAHANAVFDTGQLLALIVFPIPVFQWIGGSGWRESAVLVLVGWGIFYAVLAILARRQPPAKKPLVLTARARRILAVALAVPLLLLALIALVLRGSAPDGALRLGFLVAYLAGLGAPLLILLSNLLLVPVESLIQRRYLNEARANLRAQPLQAVGITGSYGKTSTKEFLAHLLAAKYRVLKTPHSFNTRMGIARVVRADLKPEHEVFVAEMGAYRKGEIAELAALVRPRIGILTAVGPQHLERFKTIENVAKAKYELIAALPPDGLAVFNADDAICRRLAEQTTHVRVLRYGLGDAASDADVRAIEVETGPTGTSFTIHWPDGASRRVTTRLLGRHNVSNLLAAAAVACEMGLSPDEIAAQMATLEPVPHRLQLIPGQGGVTVIDDAYNANPVGARMALEVLSSFDGGKKVLVTPGLVELGEREVEENRALGRAAARVCDYVFLVGGERTKPIAEGLRAAGFPADRLAVKATLDEVTAALGQLLRPGDVVLFENDLPDTY